MADPGLMDARSKPWIAIPRRLSAALPGALLFFVAASFALPREPAYALVFYVTVLPCVVARLSVGRGVLTADPGPILAIVLIVFSGLTLLWGTDDGHRSWRFAGGAVATLGLLLTLLLTLQQAPQRARLGLLLVGAGTLNAAFAMALFWITDPIFPRLRGWGASSHPILGAAVMSIPALTALARGLVAVTPRRVRALYLAAFATMAMFILMTESRGPLVAGAAGVVFLCAVSAWRVRACLTIAAATAIWFTLPRAVRQHSETVLVQRGSSHRFQIWDYTLGLIRDRPLFGHGLAANLHLDIGDLITFPHDLYLSLLFYSGLAGFGLFAALAALITWRLLPRKSAVLSWRDPEWAWLTALWIDLLVVGLTDLGQITKGPGPIWFIVWIPIGLLLTATIRTGQAEATHAHPL
jgi:O-antigen ligase